MKAVVDTNVVAYFLLGTPEFVDEVRQFWREAAETLAPAIWEAELANVIWKAVRASVANRDEGLQRLRFASRLGIQSVPSKSLWEGALLRAVDAGMTVYDTLFVELAIREQLPLATFDSQVLSAFPHVAVRPAALVRK
ncbi:MAG: type II toxin-antitoxin system VapC family toxin [Acidobacteriaceae bacterium]|nr:type II toxin-antitoxin system VapC family toxin [Acidobacteriaceae bacterium]MBV9296259.1 type II toxin-antitoxin system VapC family toxin [Acidobacteriaceae bacterium]